MRKNRRKKIVVTGDSMLNGVNEKGLSMSHNAKVKNYPGPTTGGILDKFIKSETRLFISACRNQQTNE